MITEFEQFEELAIRLGSGRAVGTTRDIPIFIPEGSHQSVLANAAIKYMAEQRGFLILDLRAQFPESAVSTLVLPWPELRNKWPDAEFEVLTEQSRLIIAGGPEANHVFWRMLAGESLLYAGVTLPPSLSSPRCVVVPDCAAVVAIVCADDIQSYRMDYFGAACRFNTNQVPFSV